MVAATGRTHIDAALFDLGVSSMQLDRPDRGSAYAVDAPLDMRMDPSGTLTAADVLNNPLHGELARYCTSTARSGSPARSPRRCCVSVSVNRSPTVPASSPAVRDDSGGYAQDWWASAKRTFQALRIEVNSELTALSRSCPRRSDCCVSVAGR